MRLGASERRQPQRRESVLDLAQLATPQCHVMQQVACADPLRRAERGGLRREPGCERFDLRAYRLELSRELTDLCKLRVLRGLDLFGRHVVAVHLSLLR